MLSAFTITTVEEAIGIVTAAKDTATPLALSFTLETDGRLPSGTSLAGAIETVDRATRGGPAYYMINCAHPTHFTRLFAQPGPWDRVRGIRANASRLSHAELDVATEPQRDPDQWPQASWHSRACSRAWASSVGAAELTFATSP